MVYIKKILMFIIAGITLFLISCADNNINNIPEVSADTADTEEITGEKIYMADINFDKESIFYKYADEAQDNLIKNYWNENGGIFFDKYPQVTSGGLNYWWMAHSVDVLADAYIRTGDEKYKDYADKVMASVFKKNGKVINDYYDDMQWMALAILRFYDETGERKYINYVEELWSDITKGWNDSMGGGIAWRKQQTDYKNTPANAPAAILAARLYNTLENEVYLNWAVKLFDFVDKNLVDEKTGQVWDGINRDGNGKIDKDWCFTYCHGVYIGAAVELYKITGEQLYLDKAVKTAEFALDRFIKEKDGCFIDEGEGDGGLFKGILIRYLTELYKIKPDFVLIKDIFDNNIFILRQNGTNADGLFGKSWGKAPKDGQGYDLTVQLSGVMLYEMTAIIKSIK